jgi:ketosteroid isomerase-like protein
MSLFSVSRVAGACVLAAGAALFASNARADDAADVNKLIHEHQLDEALQRVDTALAAKPRDAQMRFFKGLILSEQGHTNDAIGVFLRLTEDYPELPEPYNNLAVLYASQGEYEKARAALEMAIRTHPSYATAHENLGDVYAKLASQAYDKALQLDSSNTAAQTKLALIRELISANPNGVKRSVTPNSGVVPHATVSSPATPVAAAATPAGKTPTATTVASAQTPASVPLPTPAPAATGKSAAAAATSAPPAVAPAAPATPSAAASVAANTPAKVPAASSPASASAGGDAGAQDDVSAAVQAWAKAWSSKSIDSYLAAYSGDFVTPSGMSRKQWEEERRARIVGKSSISVELQNLEVSVDGDRAVAHFRQEYHADSLKTNSRKTLNLVKSNGRWLIQQERSGA